MFIQDSVSRIMSRAPFGLVYLAVDEPKGDPSLWRKRAQHAETDLHVRSYGERHMRSYPDTRSTNSSCSTPTAVPADQLHPRAGKGDVEDAGVGGVGRR